LLKKNEVTNQSKARAIMELFKELGKSAANEKAEIFPWRNEINLDLKVHGYYLVERKKS
jgi:hypothetical protein